MSISDKITSITGHLEDDYTALEQLGVSVEDKNIENIKDMANQIYAKFPKTSYAEGSNITLSNTLKGKLDFEDGIVGYGQTSQEGTPTPDNPQEIEVVRGKNRLDDSNLVLFNSNKYISTTNYTTQGKIAVNPSTTYSLIYISGTGTITDNGLYEFDKDNNRTTITTTNTYTSGYLVKVFKTLSTTKTMSFYAGSSDTYNTISEFLEDKKLMLLEGDYSSQEIPSYLPYNTIEIVERGKNWFTGENILDNTIVGVSRRFDKSELILNGTSTGNGVIIGNKKIITLPKGTYTFKLSLLSGTYDRNGKDIAFYIRNSENYINGNYANSGLSFYNIIVYPNKKVNFTLEEQTDIYLMSNINGDGFVFNDVKIGFQIESGDTYSDYEPYQTPQTYQLSLGEYEFAKIENYVDTIEYDVDEDKVYKNSEIGKVDLSTITFMENTMSITDYYRYSTTNIPNIKYVSVNTQLGVGLAEKYINHTGSGMSSVANCFAIDVSMVQVTDKKTDRPSGLFYYALATAVKEEITGTLKDQIKALYNSHSFTGTTIIEIDGQLPLIIKVRALKGE